MFYSGTGNEKSFLVVFSLSSSPTVDERKDYNQPILPVFRFKSKADKGLCSFFPDNEVTLNDSCSSIICFSITFFFIVVHCMQGDSRVLVTFIW